MYSIWTSHLKDPEEKERFKNQVLSARPVLERMKEILQMEEEALNQSEMDAKAYDNPAWAFKQAYKNGDRARINVTKKLVDLDQQRESTNNDTRFTQRSEPRPTGT